MHRVLFSIHAFGYHTQVLSYTFFMLLGIMVAIILGLLIGIKRGLPPGKMLGCLLIMAACTIIGSRILHALNNTGAYRENPWLFIDPNLTGFALYGGFALALTGGIITCKLLRLNVWRLADSIAPSLGIGIAIVRVGCFLNGCCFGICTSEPLGVRFPFGSSAYNYELTKSIGANGLSALLQSPPALHPTQLYEILAGLIGVSLAFLILRRNSNDGIAFLSFALWFTAFRWLDNGLRVDGSTTPVPDWFFPTVYAVLLASGLIALVYRLHDKTGNQLE